MTTKQIKVLGLVALHLIFRGKLKIEQNVM